MIALLQKIARCRRNPMILPHSGVGLRFGINETILNCFHLGRTAEWARAHFFVGGRFAGWLGQFKRPRRT